MLSKKGTLVGREASIPDSVAPFYARHSAVLWMMHVCGLLRFVEQVSCLLRKGQS